MKTTEVNRMNKCGSFAMKGHISWWSHLRDYVISGGCALFAIALSCAGMPWIFVLLLWLVAGYRLAMAAIDVLTTRYVITDDSISISSGWLATKRTELAFCDIRGVSVDCSFWHRLVGIGNVLVGNSATSDIDMRVRAIRHPHDLAAFLGQKRPNGKKMTHSDEK